MREKIQGILYKLFGIWGSMVIECKSCDFESPFAFVSLYHVKRKHPEKEITKKDVLFAFKYNLIFRVLVCCLLLIMHIIAWTLWLITYPFWAIHEIFD